MLLILVHFFGFFLSTAWARRRQSSSNRQASDNVQITIISLFLCNILISIT
jgi:hypothetical protein